MSEETAEQIGFWLGVPSLAIIVIFAIIGTVAGSPVVTRRRRESQQAALGKIVIVASDELFEIDWMRYNEVPKQQILDVLGAQGWTYADQAIDGKSWILRFTWQSAPAVQQNGSSV